MRELSSYYKGILINDIKEIPFIIEQANKQENIIFIMTKSSYKDIMHQINLIKPTLLPLIIPQETELIHTFQKIGIVDATAWNILKKLWYKLHDYVEVKENNNTYLIRPLSSLNEYFGFRKPQFNLMALGVIATLYSWSLITDSLKSLRYKLFPPPAYQYRSVQEEKDKIPNK
jgi:hypothetical protein